MAADLELGVGVAGVPTVREPDGLALSSRNVYLSADERRRALALSRALFAGRDAAPAAAPRPCSPRPPACWPPSPASPSTTSSCAAPTSARSRSTAPARLLVAARVGTTRLIDNVAVDL